MRWRPLEVQMLEEGKNNQREGTQGNPSSGAPLLLRHGDECARRWKQKTSFPASRRSPRQSPWSSPRRPRPPVRSTKGNRGACCRVSTWLPPVSINTPLHAWHNLLKQDSLFLTLLLPWLCSPNQLYFTAGCVCLTLCCCTWWRAGPWLTCSVL